ncbi:MAG: aspartate kinase [Firmicutes bacterium]|nr:aspartate kinase [Bacillota bacterium]
MRILVQKFGGTSVSDGERRAHVVRRIRAALAAGFQPVIVVSAMGRRGDPYATDTLLDQVRSVEPEPDAREEDLMISCGEVISAVLLSATLRREGVGRPLTLTGGQSGILTDDHFGDARILRVDPAPLHRRLEQGLLPVVTGFQGVTESGEVTTLGRGGSDTTAAALGVALRAEEVEIYSDVEGVMTADPRIVPDARTLRVLTYEEVLQMADLGSRIVHPRAVELAMQGNVPLRIRSTFSDHPGTRITHAFESAGAWPDLYGGRIITGVAHMPDMCLVRVEGLPAGPERAGGGRGDDSGAVNRRIFRPLAEAGVSVDLINVSPERRSFIVREAEAEKTRKILESEGFQVELLHDCAKVSVVGAGMRGLPGVMARVVEALAERGIEILQTADSHVTISCLVRGDQMEEAVRALHRAFDLGGERNA